MDLKFKLNGETSVIFWMLGIILFPYIIRNKFIPDILSGFNIISMFGVWIVARRRDSLMTKNGWSHLLITMAAILLLILTTPNISTLIKNLISIFLPIIILDLSRINIKDYKEVFKIIVRMADVSMYVVTICCIVDMIFGHIISNLIANFYGVESLYSMIKFGRVVSYFGHSLLTMEITIIYFIIHILDAFYVTNNKNMLVPTIVSTIVVTMTGSKTGILVLIVLVVLFYGNLRMLKYLPILVISAFILYKSGLFDLPIARFMHGITVGDLTSGRWTAYTNLFGTGRYRFYWFMGNDISTFNMNTSLIAALENPLMRWSYRNGIMFAILMGIRVFIIPLLQIIRGGDFKITCIALLYIFLVNSFDSVCTVGDNMLIYCSVMLLLYLTTRYKINNEITSN